MTHKRMLMAEQWDQFARAVLPPNCAPIQRQEMRRAFYAGAEGIMFKVIYALSPDNEPTDADLQTMKDLHAELTDFAELVKTGRACRSDYGRQQQSEVRAVPILWVCQGELGEGSFIYVLRQMWGDRTGIAQETC